jgi:hypothetical protein
MNCFDCDRLLIHCAQRERVRIAPQNSNGKTNDELQERINVDLEYVHQWLLANKLTLNKDNTEYMIICSRQRISNLVTDP